MNIIPMNVDQRDFTYSDADWREIKAVVFAAFGKDADQIGSGGASLRDGLAHRERLPFAP